MPYKGKIICQYGPTNTYVVSTPIGDVEIISCPKGLHSLSQIGLNDDGFTPDTRVQVKVTSQVYQDNGYTYRPALLCEEWLKKYFEKVEHDNKLPPICSSLTQSSTFTQKVWLTLRDKVKFGQTISYGQLAGLCGNVLACRAVGAAMRNNPLSLVVPCHRVIQSNGTIGNYSGGRKNKVKAWLLQHEGAIK